MTSSHTFPSPKKSRAGSLTRPLKAKTLWCADVKKSNYFQSFQSFLPFFSNAEILQQFRVIRNSMSRSKAKTKMKKKNINSDVEIVQKKKSYTKEQKLVVINYVITIWKLQNNDFFIFIIKYEVVKSFGIFFIMFRKWMKSNSNFEKMNTKIKKNKFFNINCQESKLEKQLIKLFKTKKKIEMKIDKRWFIRQTKHMYEEMYFHKMIKSIDRSDEFINFKFSVEWFNNFRNRIGHFFKTVIKKFQIVSENLRNAVEN